MNPFKSYSFVNLIGLYTAILTFLLGGFLLFIYFLTYKGLVVIVGIIYLLVATIINLTVLAFQVQGRKILPTLLILANVPIALLFFYLVGIVGDTLEINLINKTNCKITDISIINGNHSKLIEELENDEDCSFRQVIDENCTITISYSKNDKIINDTLVEILSPLLEKQHMIRYRIGVDKALVIYNDSD
jgi:hypothetical protein